MIRLLICMVPLWLVAGAATAQDHEHHPPTARTPATVPPTAEAASACARDLLSGAINSSGGFPALLAILPPGCAAAAAAIPGTAAASVPLKNIPGMPLVSPSVTGGGAVIGFYPSVAVVSGVTGRGLRECESAHIVALAAAAGCKCVLAAARGEAVGSGPTAYVCHLIC